MKILRRHQLHLALFFAVDRRFGGLHVVRCTGLDLDKAKHIVLPSDQVDVPTPSWRAEVTGHDHISQFPQMEVGRFFAAPASALMGRGFVRRKGSGGDPIEDANDGMSEPAGGHMPATLSLPVETGCDGCHKVEVATGIAARAAAAM